MDDNKSLNNSNNKAASDYALNNAKAAADSHYLETRPDPIIDRKAYEAWYYTLTAAQQRAEWDLYYKREEKRRRLEKEDFFEHKDHHAVSREYARHHITPKERPRAATVNETTDAVETEPATKEKPVQTVDPTSPEELISTLTKAAGLENIAKDIKDAEVTSYDGGMIAVKRPKQNIEPLPKKEEVESKSEASFIPASAEATVKNSIYEAAVEENKKRSNPFKPLFAALVVGGTVMLLAYNQVVFAQVKQYVRPGAQLNTPVIVTPETNPCEGQSNNIFIPKINANSPVVYDEKSWDNDKIDVALERGVVHYGTTALPGQAGNNVILGHSSGNFLNQGDFKYEFVLLDALENDDTFTMCYEGERFVYKIFRKEIVDPTDLTYIYQNQEGVPDNSQHITTLVTCHPPGTTWKRLIVQGVQISPNASEDTTVSNVIGIEEAAIEEIPSDSKSFWSTVTGWIF